MVSLRDSFSQLSAAEIRFPYLLFNSIELSTAVHPASNARSPNRLSDAKQRKVVYAETQLAQSEAVKGTSKTIARRLQKRKALPGWAMGNRSKRSAWNEPCIRHAVRQCAVDTALSSAVVEKR
jgi:hypothetical protein